MNIQKEENQLEVVNDTQGRGQLTPRIKDKSMELFGYGVTQTELRLFTYIHYQMVNEQRLSPRSVNEEEMDLLADYVKKGYITKGVTSNKGRPMMGEKLMITKDFWDKISEIIWLGYADLF